MAYGLLAKLSGHPLHVVCDRGYAGNVFPEYVRLMGAKPTIPPRRTDPPVRCDDYIYRNRNVVERLWGRLKEPKDRAANGGPSPHAMRRQPNPSWGYCRSPLRSIGSGTNGA